ncbi:hypothetical protein ACS8YF_17625 [Salinisphaera sp. SWV1]|uniref:hypothetical protein n=1 Tax=Salinisphaera sp. SWV1 TaxID=3454139 RepID=UPI003F85878A
MERNQMYFPKKSAVALAVAATFVGGAFTTAFAGTASSTYNTYATEAATAGNLGKVASPSLGYQPNQVIASGSTFTIYIKLTGGATWDSTAAGTISGTGNATYGGNADLSGEAVSSDGSVLALTFTASAGYGQQSVFSLSSVPSLVDLSNATALQTAGGKITADFAFANGAATSPVSYPSSPIDSASGTVADSQQAIQINVVSSGDAAFTSSTGSVKAANQESAQIDVSAKPPLSDVTGGLSASNVDFGAFYLTNTPGTQLNGSGADYKVANGLGKLNVTLSGNFLTNKQETLSLNTGADCASGTAVGTAVTPSKASSVDLTLPSGTVAAEKTPVFFCMAVDNSVSNPVQLPTTQPNVTTLQILDQTATTKVVDSLSSPASLYNLQENGASINLLNYVPAAAAPYMTYVRLANNGSVSAPVTVTLKGQDGSTLGSGTLGTLAAGASQTYSATQVENAAGVSLTASQRPQVQLTAPTTKLNAQSYLGDGNGGFTNMTSDK